MSAPYWIAITLGAWLLLAACGSDESCPTKPLACHASCPETLDDAVAAICPPLGFSRQFFQAENECGGKTVQSESNFTGVIYHFDGDNHLVGVTTWTDIAEDECGFTTAYGERCEASTEFTGHDCPARDSSSTP